VPGSARGVLPVKGDIIETLWRTEDDKDEECPAVEVPYCPACISYRPGKRSASGI
jgi:hypothetical protein